MNGNIEPFQNRAVIYCRVSTKEQVDEGNSLVTQQKICTEYALKNHFDIAHIFIEQGESAKTANRTELQKLLKFCAEKKNQIRVVIIYKLDRLSRNTDDYSQLRLLLKRYRVEIRSTSEHFENNPVGRFMENTMANIAQFDNDIRAERCSEGMKGAMREGRYVWMAPLGYENVRVSGKCTIAINKEKGPLIRKAFQLMAENIHPLDEVRRIITQEGLLNRKGNPVSRSNFYQTLKNEVYLGWIIKFGERHRGLFEPIVSDELYNVVQQVLKGRSKKHGLHVTDNPDFPLRRFVIDENGEKLTGSWSKGRSKKYPFYRFGGKGRNYNREVFEQYFMDYIDMFELKEKELLKFKKLIEQKLVKATSDSRKEAEDLRRVIGDLYKKQTIVIQKNVDGIISDTVLKQQLPIIEEEISNAEQRLSSKPTRDYDFVQLLNFAEEYLRKPSETWVKMKLDKKIRLQWFQFPLGLEFKNNSFGTTKIANVYKVKSLINSPNFSKVHLGINFWNQVGEELVHLNDILKDTPDQKQSSPNSSGQFIYTIPLPEEPAEAA